MRMKSALRLAKRHGNAAYWLLTTAPDEARLRDHRLGKANKPSGRRKALAMLAASVFMVGAGGIRIKVLLDDRDSWSNDATDPRATKRAPRRPRITFAPRPLKDDVEFQALRAAARAALQLPPEETEGPGPT